MGEWIPVKDRMPEEHDSVFAKYYGTPEWAVGMFKKVSDPVLAVIVYNNGEKKVHEMMTQDGGFSQNGIWNMREVTHWMPLPEPPEVTD